MRRKKTEKIQIEFDMQNECSLSFIPVIFEDLKHTTARIQSEQQFYEKKQRERFVVVCLFGDILRLLYFDSKFTLIDAIDLVLLKPFSAEFIIQCIYRHTAWERLEVRG